MSNAKNECHKSSVTRKAGERFAGRRARNLPDIELSRLEEDTAGARLESLGERRVEGLRKRFDEHEGISLGDEAIKRSHINRIDFRGGTTNN